MFKKIAKVAGGGLGGGAAFGPAGMALGGLAGGGMLGGVGNLLFGKKYGADPEADIAKEQMRNIIESQRRGMGVQRLGLEELEREAKAPVEQIAGAQIAREQGALRGATEDARRKLQETIARRGMQGSSLGLAQETSLGRDLAEKQLALGASLPERISEQRRLRAQALLSGGGGVIGAGSESNIPINFRGGRSGGISELLGAGIGAGFGGLGGAKIGAGLGGLGKSAFG